MNDWVKILGCRGSVPVSGRQFAKYGGATSCVFLRLGGQPVVLDAGTGLLALPSVLKDSDREIPLLISHPHADHLIGLPMCPSLLQPGRCFHIWAAHRQGRDPQAQIQALMAPPLWPVGPEALPATVCFHTVSSRFFLGGIQVDCLEGSHPGGVTLYRLSCGGKTVVYIPDCKLEGKMLEQAVAFASGCSLLLCDGQYAPEEWASCSNWGHSTWEMAARLGALCGAQQTRIFHHDPSHTDDILSSADAMLAERFPHCTFAYEGEEILL